MSVNLPVTRTCLPSSNFILFGFQGAVDVQIRSYRIVSEVNLGDSGHWDVCWFLVCSSDEEGGSQLQAWAPFVRAGTRGLGPTKEGHIT